MCKPCAKIPQNAGYLRSVYCPPVLFLSLPLSFTKYAYCTSLHLKRCILHTFLAQIEAAIPMPEEVQSPHFTSTDPHFCTTKVHRQFLMLLFDHSFTQPAAS